MTWPKFFAVVALAFVALAWIGAWQHAEEECDGALVRDYWNQPVCVEEKGPVK